MEKKSTQRKARGTAPSADPLDLPNWDLFRPEAALRMLQKLYKDERTIIDGLSARPITVSELFLARAPIRRKVIQLLGELFHLERVAKITYPGISDVARKASCLVAQHSQYLSLQSKYPEMIRRLSRGSLAKFSLETQWYFLREVSEFTSKKSVKGKGANELSVLQTELDRNEREFFEKSNNDDALVVRMLNIRSEIACLSGYSCWNEYATKGLTMANIGVKGISALLLRLKRNMKHVQQQRLEEYRDAFSTPRYTPDGAIAAIEEILRRHFGLVLVQKAVSVWAKDVLFYEVHGEKGDLLGGIYVDLWSRKEKVEGAWSGAVRDGEKDILPLSMVVTGFVPGKKISHYEYITLVHEFGHAVHYILSRPGSYLGYIRYLEDDAVEIAGRLFERFSFEKLVITRALLERKQTLSKDDELFVQKLPRYQKAYLVRDRSFDIAVSLFDWDIHLHPPQDSRELHERWESVRGQVIGNGTKNEKEFPSSLRYVFGGSHSAKFLIYIWADIIAGQLYQTYSSKRKISPSKAQDLLQEIFKKGSSAPLMETLRPLFGSRVSMKAYIDEIMSK